jgi:hypothetical protein
MSELSQTLVEGGPRWVKFHDGSGKAFAFLVVKKDESEDGSMNQLSGYVFCDDTDNAAGLADGVNYRGQIGRADDSQDVPGGASWSPWD